MKFQKILFFLFAALLIISAPLTGFAQINVTTLTSLSGESGETAVLPISVTDLTGQNITSFEFEASYDTSKVAITAYDSEGTISAALNTVDLNTDADGKVYVAGFGSNALAGQGVLINLNVTFKQSGATTINFANFKLNDTVYAVGGVAVTVGAVDVMLADVKGDTDDLVTMDVTVDDLTDKEILSYNFTLKYDETLMDVTGMEVAGTLSDGLSKDFTDGNGECYGGVYSDSYMSGEGVLFTLTIKLKGQGVGDIYFDPFTFNEGTPDVTTSAKKVYVGLIDVVLPTAELTVGDTTLIPVTVEDVSAANVTGYEFNFDYNVNDIDVISVVKENTLSADWTVDATINNGLCYVAGFNNVALGEGTNLVLLQVVAKRAGTSNLTWNAFQFNEGNPTPSMINGALTMVAKAAPVFTSVLADTTIAEAEALVFNYEATDANNDNLVFALVDTIEGMTVSGDGVLAWTPTYAQAGTYDVVVSVTDGGFVVNDTAVVTVTDVSREMTVAQAIVDADEDYIPDLLGQEVIVTGIVTTPSFNYGTEYAIEDGSGAGVTIYSYSIATAATLGDSIKVTGTVAQYRGKTEINIYDSTDVVVLSSGHDLPTPAEVTSFATFDFEAHENMLAVLRGVEVANPENWPTVGKYGVLDLVMGTDTIALYLDSETDLAGWEEHPIFKESFDLICMIDQYTKSTPQNDGYQMKPRSSADFINRVVNEIPSVAGVVAASATELQVRFTEDVKDVTVDNFTVAGAAPTAVAMPKANVVVLTVGSIEANVESAVVVTGVADLTDLAIVDTTVAFKLVDMGETLPIDEAINAWEEELGPWWAPTGSGSTVGVLASSAFALSEETAYVGTKSAKLTLLDDAAKDGWFVRLCNRTDKVASDSKIYLYLKGTATDVQVRFNIWDNGAGGDGYEVSAWHDITIKEDDWQVIAIDLANDPVTGWITGNGAINSTDFVTIESIQLQSSENVDATLYLDMFTERQNIAPVEVTLNVDMTHPITWNNFDPNTQFVDVAGSFNGWSGTTLPLTATENVYGAMIGEFYPGETLEFKFRMDGSWADDKSEFPAGGPNRVLVVPAGGIDTTYIWNNLVGIETGVEVPTVFALEQNYPNPFNPTTNIKYSIPENAQVKIVIYDVMGKVVRTLVNEKQSTGYQSVVWDARNDQGAKVSTGVYIYHMQANNYQQTRKMMLVK